MSGETSLDALLKTMTPELQPGIYVFVTLQDGQTPNDIKPRMIFQEPQGTTLILQRSEAQDAGLAYEFPCRMITLAVHSSLEAVGFMARIASALAKHDMGVNPVSGFFHDHLFVPEGREDDAMQVLRDMSQGAA